MTKSKSKKIPKLTLAHIERFMKQTKLMDNGCIFWTGQTRNGYGRFEIGSKRYPAHRVAFAFAHGWDLPPSWVVMHSCDNKPCVAGWHLGPGTHQDNMADRDKKRRTLHGEQIKSARLTNLQASDLKLSVIGGASLKSCATKYGIPEATAYSVASGRSYKYIEPLGNVMIGAYALVDWRLAERIRWRREQGLSVREITIVEGVKRGTVFDVLKYDRPKHAAPLTIDQALRLHHLVLKYGLSTVSNKTKLSRKTILAQSARALTTPESQSEAPAIQAPDTVPEQPHETSGQHVPEVRGSIEQAHAQSNA